MSAMTKSDDDKQILISTFFLGETLMGIDTACVQEVIRVIEMTKVYHAPNHILGIINLRGRIVTIIDLAKKLDLFKSQIMADSRIIIVQWNEEYVGLLVDSIHDAVYADRNKFIPPPPNIKERQGRFLEGVYNADDHLMAIVDVDKVLTDTDI
jgi:purine-binding chemotaxis protein CheW